MEFVTIHRSEPTDRPSRSSTTRRRFAASLVSIVILASACGSDDDGSTRETTAPSDPVAAAEARVEAAESGTSDADDALAEAGEQFCGDAEGYVEALDRYGKLFTDDAATVGDVTTAGADLVEPRETVAAAIEDLDSAKAASVEAEQELIDAQAALAEAIATASSVPVSSTEPQTATTTTIVASVVIERVEQAEADLARTAEGITEATPLAEATAEYNSAAFALQIVWLQLLADAGCFTDEQQAEGLEQVTAYTTTLQTELQLLGYYDGAIDGIYGPATVEGVKRLQADSGLPETGFVDMATAAALDDLLAALDLQTAAADLTRTAAVQTVLTVTGFWQGPVDGVWTDELTAALQQFQIRLGVEPTGVVDTATLAAFEQAIADRSGVPVTTDAPVATVPGTDEATVLVADSDLGQILTATDGMTVYLFVPDAQDTPTCTDSCAEQWPPVTVDDASQISAGDGLDASLLDSVEHPAGVQVTYNGWPLYFFAGDSAPGDTNGQGQGGVWYVVDPTGNPIDGD
jgi:predicted lipoprotein with Yx(FWY)xxD motif